MILPVGIEISLVSNNFISFCIGLGVYMPFLSGYGRICAEFGKEYWFSLEFRYKPLNTHPHPSIPLFTHEYLLL